MFLLISSLVQHKASRLVSSYQVAMQRVYGVFCTFEYKEKSLQGMESKECEVQGQNLSLRSSSYTV